MDYKHDLPSPLPKLYCAYVRVSTAKQTTGVSLIEQRAAIERYARDRKLEIGQWFMEVETAAKRGRPVFQTMLRYIEQGRARGLIIHKIDRGARNLRDWADLAELIDKGIDVRFAHDNLDLETRGGRLAADIQAVIAADYIRNLREEVRKGIDGRLRQGLYPLRAPLGYLDCGPGRAKAIDTTRAPLIVEAFTLYATGTYSMAQLSLELANHGLTNCLGQRLRLNNLAHVLHNPFYAGIIHVGSNDQEYLGVHEPLISIELYAAVQQVFRSKRHRSERTVHAFKYRKALGCGGCKRPLSGELRKGHVYYRCHQPACRGTCIRENKVEAAIVQAFGQGRRLTPSVEQLAIVILQKTVHVTMRAPASAKTNDLRSPN